MARALIREEVSRRDEQGVFLAPADLAPPGHEIVVTWNNVSGATTAELETAAVRIFPVLVEQPLPDLPVRSEGNEKVVTVPGSLRLASVTLVGLKRPGGSDLRTAKDLVSAGVRLVASIPGPGGWNPLCSVPPASARGLLPQSLTGAAFTDRTLRFPFSLQTASLKLSLVTGDFPEEFSPVTMELGTVNGVAQLPPRNVEVVGPDETVLWQFPNELLPDTPPVDVDLRVSLENAVKAALPTGSPLVAAFHVRATAPAQAVVRRLPVRGALIRAFPGVFQHVLTGDPIALALGGALAEEVPTSVAADLTVKYEGIRVLETISDPAPTSSGGVNGTIVGAQPVLRMFPPAALEGIRVARVGVIGRAPQPCEISLQLVQLPQGTAIGPPSVLILEAETSIRTIWGEVPHRLPLNGPVGLTVRANHGRFFWVTAEQPLVRIAIDDPDPAGRPLLLGNQPVVTMTETATHLEAVRFTPAIFRHTAPMLASNLFLTVDVSDLTLRYQR
ncbi:MAG: hypothetical protein AB7P18_22115 [Candidatus Binatia bacterium]